MYEVDYYIHGAQSERNSIKELLLTTTLSMGGSTDDESNLNIPLGLVMKVLADDEMHSGMIRGINTQDPTCIVLRVVTKDCFILHDALLDCFRDIKIEVDEDVENVPWPF